MFLFSSLIAIKETKVQVQRFLGTLNYQSDFIPGFAKICEPLLEYVRTDTPKKFKLSTEAMSAFEKLKQICSNETLLYFIDSKLPVFLDVDASQTAYGGVCYQVKTYSKDDLPDLQAKHLATIEKMQNEVNDELQKVLNAYVFQEDIPPYDFNIHPITEEIVKDANPHVNIATRTKITKDKVYIIHPCFLFPRNLQTLKQ